MNLGGSPQVLKGIYKRGKKFLVSFGKVSNTGKRFKTVNTMGEALAVLSEASHEEEPDTDQTE